MSEEGRRIKRLDDEKPKNNESKLEQLTNHCIDLVKNITKRIDDKIGEVSMRGIL